MDLKVTDYLRNLRMGTMETLQDMAVVPLFAPARGGPEYMMLQQSLDANLVTITEVDRSGSVPQLKAINSSERLVLLLGGEELVGAKQNRVLNTSILLGGESETIIPVSCTEAGRWSYSSAGFAKSDSFVPPRAVRSAKMRSVADSLVRGHGHSSDQGRVWRDIERMHDATGTSSPTGAMRDAYQTMDRDLEAYSDEFQVAPGQQGSLVMINGDVIGFDIVSRESAYQTIHQQLIKSYAMDALMARADPADTPSAAKALQFVNEALHCSETRYDSVGQGYDHRFQGEHMIGSALVFEGAVVHMVFLKSSVFDRKSGSNREP